MNEFDNKQNIIGKTLGNENISYTVSCESVGSVITELENAGINLFALVNNSVEAVFIVPEKYSYKADEIFARLTS